MRPLKISVVLAAFVMTSVQTPAVAARFSFAAIGDMPYILPDDFARFGRLIKRINVARPAFTIHVGDIKPGNLRCSDEHFAKIAGMFDAFGAPLIYTPSDNEWTDRHRTDNGGFDPLERLATVREQFFPNPAQSLGRDESRSSIRARTSAILPTLRTAAGDAQACCSPLSISSVAITICNETRRPSINTSRVMPPTWRGCSQRLRRPAAAMQKPSY